MRLLLALPRKAAPDKVLILDVTLCYLPQILKAVPVPLEVFQLLYPWISVTHSYRRPCRHEGRQQTENDNRRYYTDSQSHVQFLRLANV